jgi:acetyl-CoA C-acetyltransferase
MDNAVIVATARTPIGRAGRGAFNNLDGPELGAIVINEGVRRAGIEGGDVEDVLLGAARLEGPQGNNVARLAALRAGLPVGVPGVSLDRKCASGLQTIAFAAQRIMTGEGDIYVAGGLDSCSLTLLVSRGEPHRNAWLSSHRTGVYDNMIQTAENVARRYGISRLAQDEYSLLSQQRIAAAQSAGRLDAEIIPVTAEKLLRDKAGNVTGEVSVTLKKDEGNRPDSTLESLSSLRAVMGEDGCITAGNASQLSDGASVCVLMSETAASRRNLAPMGIFRGFAVAGCEPDEMGIGPVFAVPKLLKRAGLSIGDIGLWELNEAFAVQVIYCRDRLGIDPARLNVDGGAIAIGHPFGMSGSRMLGHALIEGKRRRVKYVVTTLCTAGGMGVAGLFEVL